LPKSRWAPSSLQVSYEDGRGVLRDILIVCTQQDFAVTGVEVERDGATALHRRGKLAGKARMKEPAFAVAAGLEEVNDPAPAPTKPTVTVALELRGGRSLARLIDKLSEIDGVFAVNASGDGGLVSD
jgi:putative Mg2+ transporter-C (MgtC) family protein